MTDHPPTEIQQCSKCGEQRTVPISRKLGDPIGSVTIDHMSNGGAMVVSDVICRTCYAPVGAGISLSIDEAQKLLAGHYFRERVVGAMVERGVVESSGPPPHNHSVPSDCSLETFVRPELDAGVIVCVSRP